ncbi:MAG TPA: class IV adenylate cyclase [Rectinemataceae bacterium]
MLEVELKARIEAPQALEAKLNSLYERAGSVDKNDEYWAVPLAGSPMPFPGFRLRIRTEPGRTTVTFKEKAYEGQVEVNREVEFGILDPDAFRLLLKKMSARFLYCKRKTGFFWKGPEGILVELVRVEGLGDFLEAERLVDEAESPDLEEIKRSLKRLISGLEIGEKAIEPRPYSQLLGFASY